MNKEKTTFNNSIASKLKKIMQAQGITTNKLAKQTGIPQPTLHRLLHNDNADPKLSILNKLSQHLDTPMEYFFCVNNENTFNIPIYNISQLIMTSKGLAFIGRNISYIQETDLYGDSFAIYNNSSISTLIASNSKIIINPNKKLEFGDLILVYYYSQEKYMLLNLELTNDNKTQAYTIVGAVIKVIH